MAGTSRRPHVVMSQRLDVGSTNIKVNKRQRRDVATSRRQCEFFLLIIKSKKGVQNLRYRESFEPGRGNQSSSDIDLEEEPVICIFLYFG